MIFRKNKPENKIIFEEKSFWDKESEKSLLWISKIEKNKFINRLKKKSVWWHRYIKPLHNKIILDLGCGTGASVIDLKKLFGHEVEVVGIDVVRLQIELAKKKIVENAVWAEVDWYDGENIMFPDNHFDAVYTSDVLGHVADVPRWLKELNRVLRPSGVLAMFSESELGRHAYVRKYLFNRGLNIDPHAEFHISLYSKEKLREMLEESGFEIKRMLNSFWLSFLVHPDEFYEKIQAQKKFLFLRLINKILYKIKKKLGIYGIAVAELYGLVEMLTIGRWIEGQGYIVLAKKK